MAGYSGTPLYKKLGIKENSRLYAKNAPPNYEKLISPIPVGVTIQKRLSNNLDIIHIFTKDIEELTFSLSSYLTRIKQNGAIWVSWPKKSSGVLSDVTEDIIRDVALPLGLVDIKVCAVDEVWSGLKLVIRTEHRK
jgi:hypothetical protein